MKADRDKPTRSPAPSRLPRQPPLRGAETRELTELRTRLAEANATLGAIRRGEVDAVVIAGTDGPRVFTLEGAERAYRLLIESMNEGALTLTADKTILYANQCFARFVKTSMKRLAGSSIRRFLTTDDVASLQTLLMRAGMAGSKLQVQLTASDGTRTPVQISIRPLTRDGTRGATFCLIVTDMTEARHNEDVLRHLSRRLLEAQEAERGVVALQLHDHITQLLCAIHFRTQALVQSLGARDVPSKREALKLRALVGKVAGEVERISHNLRPRVLDHLGLIAALREVSAEFTHRTGVPVAFACEEMAVRLPADIELALYRTMQQALQNVENHACADHVAVELTHLGTCVQMTLRDDGVGFGTKKHKTRPVAPGGIGLLGLRERAAYLGGTLRIASTRERGTTIEVRIPIPVQAPAPLCGALASRTLRSRKAPRAAGRPRRCA